MPSPWTPLRMVAVKVTVRPPSDSEMVTLVLAATSCASQKTEARPSAPVVTVLAQTAAEGHS